MLGTFGHQTHPIPNDKDAGRHGNALGRIDQDSVSARE